MIIINYKIVTIGIIIIVICIIIDRILKSLNKRDESKESIINKIGNIESRNHNLESSSVKESDIDTVSLYDNTSEENELIYNKEIENYTSFSSKVESQIRKKDTSFQKDEMFEWIKQIFSSILSIKSENSEFNKNIFTQDYLSTGINIHQLLGISNEIDKITTNFITFNKYIIKDNVQMVNVLLTINLLDLVDDSGNEKTHQYYERTVDVLLKRNLSSSKLDDSTKAKMVVCPVCGGSINIAESKCEYCGNFIIMDYEEWKIDNIKVI